MSNISDLTGIEAFINLTEFSCYGNQLTNIDLTQNTALTYLNCEDNQLTILDLSHNSVLDILYCDNNQLTSLNLNGAISLETLYCSENQLTSLDLSTNTILTGIWCPYNQITSLDLTQNMSTTGVSLDCWDNALTNLDIRNGLNNTWLSMKCFNNPNLTCINVDDSLFMYNWMATSPNPPQVQIDPQQYFSNNCPSATSSLCDSVVIFYNYMDTTITPNLIYFDVQVSGFGPNVGYPGFVLINNLGDTIAYENLNTAGNVFTLMPNAIETRFLEIIQNFSLPFNGFIHLVDGWFAGNPNTECIYPFYIAGITSIEEESINKKLLKVIDILGRETQQTSQPLFYIYDDGTVEKRVTVE